MWWLLAWLWRSWFLSVGVQLRLAVSSAEICSSNRTMHPLQQVRPRLLAKEWLLPAPQLILLQQGQAPALPSMLTLLVLGTSTPCKRRSTPSRQGIRNVLPSSSNPAHICIRSISLTSSSFLHSDGLVKKFSPVVDLVTICKETSILHKWFWGLGLAWYSIARFYRDFSKSLMGPHSESF